MRLLLLMPPLIYAEHWTRCRTAHLLHLFSWVRKQLPEVEVSVVDLDREMGSLTSVAAIERFRRSVKGALERERADVIGISCWTSLHFVGTQEIARVQKSLDPSVPVIVGGYHPTALPDDFREPPGRFDYVVVGEGEIALVDILAEGPVVQAEPSVRLGAPLPLEQEELDFDGFPYSEPHVFDIFLSRGCPFPCEFCVEPELVQLRGSTWRHYSWEKTEALLRDLIERRDARMISINDALFGAKKSYRQKIFELLSRYEHPPTVWCETRVDLLEEADDDYLAQLPIQIDVGLDAITPESIRRMAKSRHPEAYLQSFQRYCVAMGERGAAVKAYLIVDYPGETLETLGQTVAAAEAIVTALAKRFGKSPLFIGAQRFKLFPGAPVYRKLDAIQSAVGARFPNDGWWRRCEPDLEARAAASLPSGRLLLQGGLGGGRSAIQYLRELCKKHGTAAVRREYDLEERRPLPHPGTTYESLLGEHPGCFDGLRLRLARGVEQADLEGACYLFEPRQERSAKLSPADASDLSVLLNADRLGSGLDRLEAARDQALASVVELLAVGLLELGMPLAAGPAVLDGRDDDPQERFSLRTSEGGEVELCPVDAVAASWLRSWVAVSALEGRRPPVVYPTVWTELPVPPLWAGDEAAPGPGIEEDDARGAWLVQGGEGEWPRLVLIADSGLPFPPDGRKVASVPEGLVLGSITSRSRLTLRALYPRG
ncbi:MAG: B12-binding domain-containing radical SAM protein [Planctomycetota bacterium]